VRIVLNELVCFSFGQNRHSKNRLKMKQRLKGKVALVAGATRGAGRGIAIELGAAGATVYCTGRSTHAQPSEIKRPETIEETAELVTQAALESGAEGRGERQEGGRGIGVQVDHLDPAQVEALIKRIESERGQLDILVNDIWGGEHLTEWYKPVWEHSLEKGLHQLRLAIDTHIITSHFALPLLIKKPGGVVVELTDGTVEYNKERYRLSLFYDLAKTSINRIAWAQAQELEKHGCTAVSLTPGWLRSEQMLDYYEVKEANWRDAIAKQPHFAIAETPRYVGRAVAHLAADPNLSRWNGQSLSSGQLAKVYGFTDLDGSQPDAWRYVVEVQEAGKPADVTGYR
jgi:NAD(P)-dependent dehydrogenase (short-subunit alcohol dehydrogenase family)